MSTDCGWLSLAYGHLGIIVVEASSMALGAAY